MSHLRPPDQIRVIEVRSVQIDQDGRYPPQPAQDKKTSQRLSHYSDTSIPLFFLYIRISEEHDRRKYELFKGEIDSILVFSGLFSATVAALAMPSIAPSNNAIENGPGSSPLAVTNPRLVNSLWLCSLILSIYCALHALLLQRWANRRTWVASSRYCLPEQARMGAYFARRIERANEVVRRLHLLILISLVVFFSGLIIFFTYVGDPIALIISVPLIAIYPLLFLETIKRPRSPHCTPSTQQKFQRKGSWLDGDVLKRTLDMSRLDDDLEQFFEAIPGFCTSKIVDNPRRSLDVLGLPRLAEALIGFWNCTLSSNRVSESVKVRRLVVCMRVIEAADLSIAIPHILHLFFEDLSRVSRSIEIGHSLRPLRNGNAYLPARGIIASIISNAEERNDRWFTLAVDELGVSVDVLHNYLAHGDSVLLANMIHITRHILHGLLQPHPDLAQKTSSILSSLSKFDILNTLPELQHDFCALWNEIVQQARVEADIHSFISILVEIWHLYIALHGTDVAPGYVLTSTAGRENLFHQPASYPLCVTPDHHPKSTTHTHEASCSTTGGASQATTTASPILSVSSPGDALQADVSQHTTTSTFITQSIADTSIPSGAETITQSPSTNRGDQPSDEGITRQEFASSTLTNALSRSNPQALAIFVPNITGRQQPPPTNLRDNEDI